MLLPDLVPGQNIAARFGPTVPYVVLATTVQSNPAANSVLGPNLAANSVPYPPQGHAPITAEVSNEWWFSAR